MARKKETEKKVGSVYKISTDSKDNPRLVAKVLSNGTDSLYLDYYDGFDIAVSKTGREYKKPRTRRETLGLYIRTNPRTPIERQNNNDIIEMAKNIRHERSQEFLKDKRGYRLKRCEPDFYVSFEKFMGRDKKCPSNLKSAYVRFRSFIAETDEYKCYASSLKLGQVTKTMVEDYTDYLREHSRGDGARAIYVQFKKFFNRMVEDDLISKSPCVGIVVRSDNRLIKKDILSRDEFERLARTDIQPKYAEVKRAFLFSMYCGMRNSDVRALTYGNIDYANRRLSFVQTKTKARSGCSGVVMPLNDSMLRLLGESHGYNDERVFNLPSIFQTNKALDEWVKAAGINKHITWHCARHSFAMMTLGGNANIKVVSELLGHTTLRTTEVYVRALDEEKRKAIESLPMIDF